MLSSYFSSSRTLSRQQKQSSTSSIWTSGSSSSGSGDGGSTTMASEQDIVDRVQELDRLDDRIESTKVEILRVRLKREFAFGTHAQDSYEKRRIISRTFKRLQQKKAEYKQEQRLHRYVTYLKERQTPSFIRTLESKVLRDVHQICVVENQLEIAKSQSDRIISLMRTHLQDLSDERVAVEREVLNQMFELRVKQDKLIKSHKVTLETQTAKIEALKRALSDDKDTTTTTTTDAAAADGGGSSSTSKTMPTPATTTTTASSGGGLLRFRRCPPRDDKLVTSFSSLSSSSITKSNGSQRVRSSDIDKLLGRMSGLRVRVEKLKDGTGGDDDKASGDDRRGGGGGKKKYPNKGSVQSTEPCSPEWDSPTAPRRTMSNGDSVVDEGNRSMELPSIESSPSSSSSSSGLMMDHTTSSTTQLETETPYMLSTSAS